MTHRTLARLSGLSAIIGGTLYAVHEVMLFLRGIEVTTGDSNANLIWATLTIGMGFLLPGLTGLYMAQAEESGALGFIAFVVTFVAALINFGVGWGGAAIIPAIRIGAPHFLTIPVDAWFYNNTFMISWVSMGIGILLFGLATWQANVFPRGAAMAMIMGAMFGIYDAFDPFGVDIPAGPIILGAGGVIWIGIVRMTQPAETKTSP